MKANDHYDIEINLRDLFFHLLYRWRSLIVFSIIGALLFCGYTWYSNQKARSYNASLPDSTVTSDTYEKVEKSILPYKLSNKGYEMLLRTGIDYYENAPLMKIDPNREWQANADYLVILDKSYEKQNNDLSASDVIKVASAYRSAIFSTEDNAELSEIYGEKSIPFVSELFNCTINESSNGFTVTAIGSTREMAESGLNYLKKSIDSFEKDKGQALCAHHLQLINEYSRIFADTVTETRQITVIKNLSSYQTSISIQDQTIDSLSSSYSPPIAKQEKSLSRSVIIGFVVGLFLTIVFFSILYVFSGKIHESEVFQRKYSIPVYGQFIHSRARHPGKGFDKFIEKLEFKKDIRDQETILGNIRALIEDRANSEILLTGTISASKLLPLCEAIKKDLKQNIHLRTEGDLLHNSRAIEAANHVQDIILVEELHETTTKDLRRAAEILTICETPVIGSILI